MNMPDNWNPETGGRSGRHQDFHARVVSIRLQQGDCHRAGDDCQKCKDHETPATKNRVGTVTQTNRAAAEPVVSCPCITTSSELFKRGIRWYFQGSCGDFTRASCVRTGYKGQWP